MVIQMPLGQCSPEFVVNMLCSEEVMGNWILAKPKWTVMARSVPECKKKNSSRRNKKLMREALG